MPGLLILPQADISLVPVLLPMPILAYSSPPILIMGTTAAIVSTLFTTVGRIHTPSLAANGGVVFAADVCSRAAIPVDLTIEACAEDVVTKPAVGFCLGNCFFQDIRYP